ncbi:MAG: tyrosine-type recombinase/integrase family protein [Clostridia bacterium]|nr:tyrosine-type recombinase/integrase family protein [Clostridia bacterium]
MDDVLQQLPLDNLTASRTDMPEGETDMAKSKRIKRAIIINGVKRWICGNSEQEYADHIIHAYLSSQPAGQPEQHGSSPAAGHDFKTYARQWFEVFSKPNIAQVTANTYERNLHLHICPAFKGKNIEEIDTADVQNMFNSMSGAKQTKAKAKVILNMIFQQAIEDGLITKNPLHSRSIRITGSASKPTKPYTVEQMRFLVQNIGKLSHPMDKAYLALQALHPLRLEEVLGLKGEDVDKAQQLLHICRAVTHPDRNLPQIKETKTQASNRTLDLVGQIIMYLPDTPADEFILGGKDPLSYTQVRRMCERIRKETGFDEPISPIRFRTTVLTDLYDTTKDIKQAQAAAGHTTAAMTLKHYVKGRHERQNTAAPIASVYGLAADTIADTPALQKTYTV